MANTGKFRYDIEMNVNKASLETAKSQFNDLIKHLQQIQAQAKNADILGKADENIRAAATEAKKLQDILNASWNPKINQLNLSKFQNELSKSGYTVTTLKKHFDQIGQGGTFNRLATEILGANTQLKTTNSLLDKMSVTFANTIRYGISSSVFNNLTNSISQAYNYTKNLDKSLNDIRIVSNASADDMERFAKYANNAAKNLGASTLDYTKGALIYYQQGLSEEEVKQRTDVTLQMANVLGSSASEVSDYMTAIWNNFDNGSKSLEYYADVITALGAATASSSEEIAEGLNKFAAVADTVGLSYDYATSALATVVAETRQSADVVGTAFKTLFARIQDLELGNTLDDGTTLGQYAEALEKVGINIKDQSGELKDMNDILNEMGAKWQTLSKDQQVALAQNVAGVRQYTQLVALMDNWDTFQQNLNTAQNSQGTLAEQQDIYMQSLDAHLQKLSTEAERTWDTIFDEETLKSFADIATGVLKQINDALSGMGGGLNAIANIAARLGVIFRKQIGNEIIRIKENYKTWKDEAANLAIREETANAILQENSNEGISTNTSKNFVQEQAETYKELLNYRKAMTKEEFDSAITETKKLALLQQEKEYFDKIGTEALERDSEGNITKSRQRSIGQIKAQNDENIKQTKKDYETIENFYTNLLKNIEEIDSQQLGATAAYEEELKQVENTTESIKTLKEGVARAGDTQFLTEQQINHLNEISKKLTEGKNLTYEDGVELEKIILQTETQYNEELREQLALKERINAQGGATRQSLEQDTQNQRNLVQEIKQQASNKSRAITGTQITMAAVQGLTTLNGLVQVFGNESSTAADKANAAFQGVAGGASAIADLIAPGSGILVQGVMSFGKSILEATGLWDGFVNAFKSDAEKAQEKIDQLRESAQKFANEAEELKNKVDNLKSSFDQYTQVREILDSCNKSTLEWDEAFKNVNQTILEILQKYPELAKIEGLITKDNNGLLSINKELYDAYIQQTQNKQIITQATSLRMQNQAQAQQNDLTKNQLQKDIGRSISYGIITSNRNMTAEEKAMIAGTASRASISDEYFNELRESAKIESEYNEVVKKMAQELVNSNQMSEASAEQWTEQMSQYRDQLNNYTQSIEDNANSIKNANKIITSAVLGPNANNIQSALFSTEYDKIAEEEYQKQLKFINDNVKRSDNRLSSEVIKRINETTGGQYSEAQEHSNQVVGNDGDRGIWVYDRQQQKDVMYTNEEWARIMGNQSAIEKTLNKGVVSTGDNILKNVSKYSGLDENLINTILGENFDINQLDSAEQAKDVRLKADKIIKALEDSGEEGAKGLIDHFEKAINSEWDSEKHAQYLEEQFNQSLASAANNAETNFDLDKEAFKGYGEYIAEIANESDELADSLKNDGDAAGIVTKSVMRMNRGIETLADGMEDWNDILKNSTKESYEYWEALDHIKDGLSDVLDVEKDSISNKFIEDHLDDITKAAEGNEEAIDGLRDAYADQIILDIAAEIDFSDEKIKTTKDKMIEQMNELQAQIPALEIGAVDDTAFIESCQNLIDNANMTTEQANAMFAAMGFEAEYAEESQSTTTEVPVYSTYKQVTNPKKGKDGLLADGYHLVEKTYTVQDGSVTLPGTVSSYSMGVTTNDGKNVRKPKIKKLTKKAGGSSSNYSSRNAGGGGAGGSSGSSGGGGSSSEPKRIDPLDEEADRYHKVNTQIQKVENSLKKVESQQDKFVGGKLIANLNEQWNLLNKQIENYNEKLRIANEEQAELRQKLSGKGVQFNADGTISNYMESFAAQEAYVNGLIAQYNSLSAAEQEAWDNDKRIDNAKEDFEKFKTNLDRYDELVSDFIPQLQQNIQDEIDKQIEINIQKFNMEVEITLNMDQATRDWNAWAKRAMDGIDPENILGNAQARLKDFYTYFNQGGTADIQVETRHLNDLLNELYKMDAGQNNIYGDNRAQALEDLEKYYTTLIQSITDVIELQDELHQALLDEMDEVQEKFDEQIDSYQFLRDLINHDMKVIELTLGEDAYGEMTKFYQMQQENYEKQLDFQRQQKDFWYAQMQAAEEGSQEWESARDKWKEAVNEFNSILEEGLENARSKFENSINDIFKRLNESITGGMGLDYVNTQWDLINQNADRYLDTINATYGIRELEKKYQDSIRDTDNVAVQQRLQKVMEEQLDGLKERDRLTQYDLDRANKLYELELARIALEEAQRNKSKMELKRDSQGNYSYRYVADQDAMNEAEAEVSKLYNDLYNFDKDRYNQVLNDIYDIWDNYQQAMAEAALINDPELRAEKERLIQEQYNELMMQAEEDYQVAKYDLQESFFWDWVDLNDMTLEQFQALTDNEKDIIMTDMVPTWKNGVSEMAEAFAGEAGFAEVTTQAWDEIKAAENVYADDMVRLEEISGQTFDAIVKGEDNSIAKGKDLIKNNKELITAYGNELAAVQKVYDKVKQLRQEYEKAEKAAIAATKAAYEYQQKELAKQAAAAKAQQATTSSAGTAQSNSGQGSSNGSTGAAVSTGGDGAITVGETVTYTGGAYYANSYGGGPSGNRGPGKKVKITNVVNGRPYPIHVMSTDSAYGWLRKDQLAGYDTGGYTGTWGNSGRLAVLHQKELVLNAQDTENMLNTVAIMRSLAYSLGSNVLARMAGASANGLSGNTTQDGVLQQDVHIDAQFPNVRNAAEIEEALNNLVNAASQRVYEK